MRRKTGFRQFSNIMKWLEERIKNWNLFFIGIYEQLLKTHWTISIDSKIRSCIYFGASEIFWRCDSNEQCLEHARLSHCSLCTTQFKKYVKSNNFRCSTKHKQLISLNDGDESNRIDLSIILLLNRRCYCIIPINMARKKNSCFFLWISSHQTIERAQSKRINAKRKYWDRAHTTDLWIWISLFCPAYFFVHFFTKLEEEKKEIRIDLVSSSFQAMLSIINNYFDVHKMKPLWNVGLINWTRNHNE